MNLKHFFLLTLITTLTPAIASVNNYRIPDVLYEGSLITFYAKRGTLLNTSKNELKVSVLTADNQEIPLEIFVNKRNTKAQAVLPTLPSSATSNVYRVTLKISGADISSDSPLGVVRFLSKKPNTNLNLSAEKPIDPLISLNDASEIPSSANNGLFSAIITGPQGATGPQGPVGATGAWPTRSCWINRSHRTTRTNRCYRSTGSSKSECNNSTKFTNNWR